jgi:hypothetical protein
MTLQSKVVETPDVAVLCRSHPIYLEHAAQIGRREPERRITFRTSAVWKSGEAALEAHGPRQVYFFPDTGGNQVEYVATLREILLYPTADDPATEQLLADCLPEAQGQGLWEEYDEQVRTLYAISHCRKVESTFPYTALTKLSDGTHVDENYSAGYVLVYEYCQECHSSPCRC